MSETNPADRWAAFTAFRVSVGGHVAEIELVGTGKGNRMGPAFWRELPEVFAAIDAADDVRVAILRGAGDTFTYGLDLASMGGEIGAGMAEGALAAARTKLHELILRMQGATSSLARCRKPVIAAIAGWCVGGGIDLVSFADVRLASAEARFSVREVKLAIVADLGTLQRLPYLVGHGHARRLALTGEDFDAAHAARIGLVQEVLPDPAALLSAARAMAKTIAENPPLVVSGIKQVMEASMGRPPEDGLRHVALWNSAFLPSRDLQEALMAFVEKRPPSFRGE
jgi:enoyl-CoA hydratase